MNYMVENGLINIHKIQDLDKFIDHLDKRRKKMLMKQMMEKR